MSVRAMALCGLTALVSVTLPTGCSKKGINITSREPDGFFPPATCGPDQRTHDIHAEYPSRLLMAMSEPALCSKEWAGRTVFRLLIVPTWGEPACVRLEKRSDGACQGTVTVLHPSGGHKTGFKPGAVKRKDTVQVSAKKWNRLGETIQKTGFLDLQSWDDNVGCDGTTSIAEFVDGGRYRAVRRWGGCPENKAFNLVAKEALEAAGLSRDLLNVNTAVKVRDGEVVLVRLKGACGGFRVSGQNTTPEQVQYEWAFRDDGRSVLSATDAVRTGSGVAGLKEPIEFGPFRVKWSGCTEGMGWVYYATKGWSTTPGLGICAAGERQLDGVDTAVAEWEYWTSPFDRMKQ